MTTRLRLAVLSLALVASPLLLSSAANAGMRFP